MERSIIEELIGGMPSWTEEANCKGADADIFFLKGELPQEKLNLFVGHALYKKIVLNLQSKTQKSLVFGVVYLKEKEDESNAKEFMTVISEKLAKKY